MYCKKCGSQLPDNARFCGVCGTEVAKAVLSNNEKMNKSTKKKSKKIAIIIGALILVLIAVILAVFFVMKDKLKVKEYENYMSMAEKYVEELDYEQAEDFYLKAIKIDEKQREPYVELAKIYVEQEEYEKAEDILEKADEAGAKATDEISEEEEEIIEQLENNKENAEVAEKKITEGYYKLKAESADLSGALAVMEDYKGITTITFEISDESRSDDSGYEKYEFKREDGNTYIETSKEECSLVVTEEEDELNLILKNRDEEQNYTFERNNNMNTTTITLALKNYYDMKNDGQKYAFETDTLRGIYHAETETIAIYTVNGDEIENTYIAYISGAENDVSGYVSIYRKEDVYEAMDKKLYISELEVIDEFYIYDYYDFE